MVCVAQDTNSTRLHHHSQRKIQRIFEPPFGESAEDMAMSDLKSLSAYSVDKSKRGQKQSKGKHILIPARHPQHDHHANVVPVARISYV